MITMILQHFVGNFSLRLNFNKIKVNDDFHFHWNTFVIKSMGLKTMAKHLNTIVMILEIQFAFA